MMGAAGELILPRRARPQPHPEIHQGGDCGACAVAGVLGMEVAEVYQAFDSKGITNVHEMARVLRCASMDSRADRILDTPAEWPTSRYFRSFGSPAVNESLAWFNYIRMAIDAGYYGVAMVDFAENGGPETNHWVVICGARTKGMISGEVLTGDLLMSCSVKGERWWEARHFLQKLGGYDTLLLRPAP